MDLSDSRIGFALTGSFCTLKPVIEQMKVIKAAGANVIPIMSEMVFSTDTRFGKAVDFINQVEEICGNEIIASIEKAEPIGPKKLLDLMIIAPCTGNTLAKLALGVNDGCVTMAAKAHLRNGGPLLLFVSTNDGLAASAKNIGMLLNYKNVYFTPFGQDDFVKKPNSLVAKCDLLVPSAQAALNFEQLQPVIM